MDAETRAMNAERLRLEQEARNERLTQARAALQEGAGFAELWESIWVLLVMGAVFVPLGLFVFHLGERYAKKTGKLKRSG